jgi:hypothetical protein
MRNQAGTGTQRSTDGEAPRSEQLDQEGKTMKIESVEIYSYASNQAVMRHPGRSFFPGVWVQGDTLQSMAGSLRYVAENSACLNEKTALRLREVTEQMEELVAHYRSVLTAHGIMLPFGD